MSEYMEFIETHDTGKTKVFDVRTLGGSLLGVIKWHGPWRQYVFFPALSTLFNTDCLDTIIAFINGLMAERVEAKRKCCVAFPLTSDYHPGCCK